MAERSAVVGVVGAGIVGLSCAYHLSKKGFQVKIIDRDPSGDRASNGNAGAIATAEILPLAEPGIALKVPGYLFDPLGPLSMQFSYLPWLWPYLRHFLAAANRKRFASGAKAMAALLATALRDHEALLDDIGQNDLLVRRPGLFVYRSEAARKADAMAWALRREFGLHAEILDRAGIESLEPALGAEAACGYATEDWAFYKDPKRLSEHLRDHLQCSGVEIISGNVVDVISAQGGAQEILTDDGLSYAIDHLVIAAGAWSHRLSKMLGDEFPLETERGYNTTLPDANVNVRTMTTFAEDHFVMTPMDMGLRIGGAVEFAGLEAPPNFKRSEILLILAKRYLPGLNISGGKAWMGHRPSTPDSLPVIDRSPRHSNVFYAFGHGHLGLTGSLTTGRIISSLVRDQPVDLDLAPFRIDRF